MIAIDQGRPNPTTYHPTRTNRSDAPELAVQKGWALHQQLLDEAIGQLTD